MANEIHVDYASGSTLYAVIRDGLGQVWRSAGQAFESWGTSDHTADDYDIPLLDKGGNRYVGAFDVSVPAGAYSIQVLRQIGVAPADTDPFVSGRSFLWTGSGELTPLKILANRAVYDKVTGAIDYYDDDDLTVLFTQIPAETQSATTRIPASEL